MVYRHVSKLPAQPSRRSDEGGGTEASPCSSSNLALNVGNTNPIKATSVNSSSSLAMQLSETNDMLRCGRMTSGMWAWLGGVR